MPTPPSGTRKWLAIVLAAVTCWVIFLMTAGDFLKVGQMTPPALEVLEVPRPAEFRWELEDLDGQPVDFARYKGRPILLNLWATWCGPCLQEMPSIARLAASKDLEGRDVAFVCVSTDESAEALRRFMKGKDWPMTVLRAKEVPPAYQTQGIPATFLISPDGRIAAAEIGAAQWDDPSVAYFLQKLARAGGK